MYFVFASPVCATSTALSGTKTFQVPGGRGGTREVYKPSNLVTEQCRTLPRSPSTSPVHWKPQAEAFTVWFGRLQDAGKIPSVQKLKLTEERLQLDLQS